MENEKETKNKSKFLYLKLAFNEEHDINNMADHVIDVFGETSGEKKGDHYSSDSGELSIEEMKEIIRETNKNDKVKGICTACGGKGYKW